MNNNDLMFITFKLKTLEELLQKIIIKVGNIDFDVLQINKIAEDLQDELDITLQDVNNK